jgi:hypothetical protein
MILGSNSTSNISYDKSWNGYRIQISSIKKLRIIYKYLNIYKLKTKKLLAFHKICKLDKLIYSKEHLTDKGLKKMEKFCKNINKLKVKDTVRT